MPEKYVRPSWDEYFMEIAHAAAKRATCDRGRTACVIVRDKQILATGYVGSPPGVPHCDDVGHLIKTVTHEDGRVSEHCMRTIHAESNAIARAAKLGVALDGATLYCKLEPCFTCAKTIASVGIKRIVCEKRYHGGKDGSEEIFKQAGITIEYLSNENEDYARQ